MQGVNNFVSCWDMVPPQILELGSEDNFFDVISQHVSSIKAGRSFILEVDNDQLLICAGSLRVILRGSSPLKSFWMCATETSSQCQECQPASEWIRYPDVPQCLVIRKHGNAALGGILGDAPFAANGRLAYDSITRSSLLKALDLLAEAVPCPQAVRDGFCSSLARAGIFSWRSAGEDFDGNPAAVGAVGQNPFLDGFCRGTFAKSRLGSLEITIAQRT
eukprot:1460299-Amphidinium_carterae.1